MSAFAGSGQAGADALGGYVPPRDIPALLADRLSTNHPFDLIWICAGHRLHFFVCNRCRCYALELGSIPARTNAFGSKLYDVFLRQLHIWECASFASAITKRGWLFPACPNQVVPTISREAAGSGRIFHFRPSWRGLGRRRTLGGTLYMLRVYEIASKVDTDYIKVST